MPHRIPEALPPHDAAELITNEITSFAGCGLCQTDVPCEFRNPMRNGGKETS